MPHVSIDPNICQGHGRCYRLVPDIFEPDDEGFGTVKSAEVVGADAADLVARAIRSCPERAISIAD